jgi:predicted acylesterase/phospholipase RssA
MNELSQDTTSPKTPDEFSLGNIALSFSGGGYRASAFHLGMLDCLHKLGLIDQVTMLSTVSGGALVGAKYIDELCKDPEKENPDFFDNFFDGFYNFLKNQALPDRWLKQIKIQKKVTPDLQVNSFQNTTPSLIRAAANIYSESIENGGLLGETRLGIIKEAQARFHIKEIIFNTTELHTGLGFRFRVGNLLSNEDKRIVGNKYFRLPSTVTEKIRLADVVAASSCFPGGFEPILFPQDFNWPEGSWKDIENKIKSSLQVKEGILKTLPLTDGGIYDNLGVNALIETDKWLYDQFKNTKDLNQKRNIESKRIGTLILSDTDNIGIDEDPDNKGNRKIFYSPPKSVDEKKVLKIKLRHISWFIPILFLFSLVSEIVLGIGTIYLISIKAWQFVFFGIWIGILLMLIIFLLGMLTDFVSSLKYLINSEINLSQDSTLNSLRVSSGSGFQNILSGLQKIIKDWDGFLDALGGLSIADISNLINSRLLSVEPLFLSFLKNQQRRVYNSVYESNVYRNKAISCFIYDIKKTLQSLQKNPLNARFSFISNFESLEKMAELSDEATRTPTTLWFDKDNAESQIDTLIACGQFTMCFNLIEHLNRQKKEKPLSDVTEAVYYNAVKFWNKFEKDPKFLVGESRINILKNFK